MTKTNTHTNTNLKVGYRLKEFLWPITQDWSVHIMAAVHHVLWWIRAPVAVFLIREITYGIETKDWELTKRRLLFFSLFIGGLYIVRWSIKKYSRNALPTALRAIHRRYIPHYIQLDNTGTARIGTGKFVAVINKGMTIRAEWATKLRWRWIRLSVSVFLSFVIIWITDRKLAIVSLFGMLILAKFIGYLDKKAVVWRDRRRDHEHQHTEQMVKIVMSKFEVMQAGNIDTEIEKLDQEIDWVHEKNVKVSNYVTGMFYIPSFLLDLLKVWLVLYVGYGVIQGTHLFADFVAILWVIEVLAWVIDKGVEFFKNITKNISYVHKLLDLFDGIPMMKNYDTWKSFDHKTGEVKINKISFSYADEELFKDFSLLLQWKRKTALVGVSGSWKTTLMKLIAWYVEADSGSIEIDGQKLPGKQSEEREKNLSLKSYYAHIGYLTQEPMVFDGTIFENLIYALSDKNNDDNNDENQERENKEKKEKRGEREERIKKAIWLAQCDFVYDLPKGIHTQIGERGIRLSWGQRQRLAIAKIFLKNPEIILLDEPTSALDSFSEEAVTVAMNNLFEWRTVIIIAHRLQTVKAADDIIVLEKGKVIERGTHKSLQEKNGHYAQMLELQSGF